MTLLSIGQAARRLGLRFGSELLVTIARHFGTTIHFINDHAHTFE